ncbi:MAG: hypothetical protein P1V51_24650 [Deltaproteobacteria bacterium]|nr:hypothetical protein [Deltaproteobacteria bacterium]
MTSARILPRLLLLFALAASGPARGEATKAAYPPLRIHGNILFSEEVYRSILRSSLNGEVPGLDEATAGLVQQKLEGFLHGAGYQLAAVRARVDGETIDVQVDEGRVEKVVFRGKLTVKTLRFKLALRVPHDVYNRLELEREGALLAEELGIDSVRFELVPTKDVEHLGPQLESLGHVQGHSLIGPRRPYELHVFFGRSAWNTGLGLDLKLDPYNGLQLGLNYQGKGLIFQEDRFRVAGSGGARLASRLHDERRYPAFSRGLAELKWLTPPLFGGRTRPFLWLRADVTSRQRPDLDLERYFNTDLEASLDIQHEFTEGLTLELGGGIRRRYLFGLRPRSGATLDPLLAPDERVDPFAMVRTELVFDTGAERWDRRHELVAEARRIFTLDRDSYNVFHYQYQWVVDLGWHALWLRSRGVWMRGSVPFHDEHPVGGPYLRGVFQESFARQAVSASADLRFSITRDLYKLGAFVDGALFGELDRGGGTAAPAHGVSFGPSFHALIEDMLQLDVFVAFGFASGDRFEAGAAVGLKKVF